MADGDVLRAGVSVFCVAMAVQLLAQETVRLRIVAVYLMVICAEAGLTVEKLHYANALGLVGYYGAITPITESMADLEIFDPASETSIVPGALTAARATATRWRTTSPRAIGRSGITSGI